MWIINMEFRKYQEYYENYNEDEDNNEEEVVRRQKYFVEAYIRFCDRF